MSLQSLIALHTARRGAMIYWLSAGFAFESLDYTDQEHLPFPFSP